MSVENCLVLQLQGPLQSWGTESRFEYCKTGIIPSRSAIAGMLCAALGLDRGSAEEAEFLQDFSAVRMTAISVQKSRTAPNNPEKKQQPVSADIFFDLATDTTNAPENGKPRFPMRRMEDYHTVQNTIIARTGQVAADAVITRRHYLNDASFLVFLAGQEWLVHKMAEAIKDPVWGVWLGRKACLPSAPVFAGLFSTQTEAERKLLSGLIQIVREEDCSDFNKRTEFVNDVPLSFVSSDRCFAQRGVHREWMLKENKR